MHHFVIRWGLLLLTLAGSMTTVLAAEEAAGAAEGSTVGPGVFILILGAAAIFVTGMIMLARDAQGADDRHLSPATPNDTADAAES